MYILSWSFNLEKKEKKVKKKKKKWCLRVLFNRLEKKKSKFFSIFPCRAISHVWF